MSIPHEHQVAFLKELIEQAKKNLYSWSQIPSDSIAASHTFPNEDLDKNGVFSYTFPHGIEGHFIVAINVDGCVKAAVGVTYDLMQQLDNSDKEISLLLTRLFYLIFDCGASARRIIERFLALRSQETEQ